MLTQETRVAYYNHMPGMDDTPNRTENDLEGRAWLSTEDGSLTINSLMLSDQHWYTCYFTERAKVYLAVHVRNTTTSVTSITTSVTSITGKITNTMTTRTTTVKGKLTRVWLFAFAGAVY